MIKKVKINFVYIDNNISDYKQKDIVKLLNGKDVISHTNISDKPGIDVIANKNLVACLMLKKFNRLLSKNKENILIYYFISQFNKEILSNLDFIVNKYSSDIIYELFTNNMDLKPINNITEVFNIEKLFENEGEPVV